MIFSVETDIPKWKELKCKKTFYVETDNMPDKILKFRVGEVECSFEGNFDIEIHIRKSVYEKLLSGEYEVGLADNGDVIVKDKNGKIVPPYSRNEGPTIL